uniref:Uncharacterized protein n=1 Tax=Schizaphis graminum TaxID=13262 RepID=A0A2S2PJS5_SCHGA
MTGRSGRGGRHPVIDPCSGVDSGSVVAGRDEGSVSRAPADGGVGPAGDNDPGALTSYVSGVAVVETFTFATSRTFCVLDKVLVALGRTKVVYSLYTLAHPRYCHDRNDLYMRFYVIYIYIYALTSLLLFL